MVYTKSMSKVPIFNYGKDSFDRQQAWLAAMLGMHLNELVFTLKFNAT